MPRWVFTLAYLAVPVKLLFSLGIRGNVSTRSTINRTWDRMKEGNRTLQSLVCRTVVENSTTWLNMDSDWHERKTSPIIFCLWLGTPTNFILFFSWAVAYPFFIEFNQYPPWNKAVHNRHLCIWAAASAPLRWYYIKIATAPTQKKNKKTKRRWANRRFRHFTKPVIENIFLR